MTAKGIVYVNGKFFPAARAALPVSDLTIQRGYGANDVFRTYNRKPFLLEEHLKRLKRSTELMMMRNAPSPQRIKKIVTEGIRRVPGELLIKIIVTGGPSNHITPLGKPGLLVYFLPFHGHPESHYRKGFRMMTTRALRTLPDAKSIDYFAAVMAQIRADRTGFDEAIFYDGRRLLEGTTFSIGVIQGRNLIVPKRGTLDGITMRAVIRVAPRAGLRVMRRDITFADLKKADEMISTSTIREVLSVVCVDKIKIGAGRPGPYSTRLRAEFQKYAQK